MIKKTIVLISHDDVLSGITEKLLSKSYNIEFFKSVHPAIDYIYNSIPDLVVMDMNSQDAFTLDLLNNLKGDPIFRQLPVLAILDETQGIPQWDTVFVEDYIKKSDFEKEGPSRVNLSILRSERISEVNPLTKLPGNVSINKQIQNRLDRNDIFALAYADLDHFKPFNDYYGFTRGDEVIRITGRLILNIVKNLQPQDSFVGHIGGDDFVFIIDINLAETAAKEIIDTFDRIIPALYETADRGRGYIETQDRRNNIARFPLVTISIGITSNFKKSFTHYGEITEIASEMKALTKRIQGSCYMIDRRQIGF